MLEELVRARGPGGQESEVQEVARSLFDEVCEEVWLDAGGNLIAHVAGDNRELSNAVRLIAHADEIGLVIQQVEESGNCCVRPIGGIRPHKFGEGPWEILAGDGTVSAVLSYGSSHLPPGEMRVLGQIQRSAEPSELWDHARLITRLSRENLEERGVMPGTRVVLHPCVRQLLTVEDCIAGHFLDDRAGIAVLAATIDAISKEGRRPKSDVFVVISSQEERGSVGAQYALTQLSGHISIAVDVVPVAEYHGIELSPNPIVVYGDGSVMYDKQLCDELMSCGAALPTPARAHILSNYRCDSGIACSRGLAGRAGLLGVPTANTHGFEVVCAEALMNCVGLLTKYLAGSRE